MRCCKPADVAQAALLQTPKQNSQTTAAHEAAGCFQVAALPFALVNLVPDQQLTIDDQRVDDNLALFLASTEREHADAPGVRPAHDPGFLARLDGGDIMGGDVRGRTAKAEKWLKRHPEDAQLLMTLGRLCREQQLWGKAESYLEAALAVEPGRAPHLELARLYDIQVEDIERQVAVVLALRAERARAKREKGRAA